MPQFSRPSASLLVAALIGVACGRTTQAVPDAVAGAGASAQAGAAGAPLDGSGGQGASAQGGLGSSALGGSAGRVGAAGGAGGAAGMPSDECTVAVRVGCCEDPIAVSAAALGQDPCLVAYPASNLDLALVSACIQASPGACPRAVSCDARLPPSRILERVADGSCRFADECQADADCVVAIDSADCCVCQEPFPRALVDAKPCLLTSDDGDTRPCEICELRCRGCAAREQGSVCAANRDGVARCEWGPPLSDGQCASERSCDGAGYICQRPGVVSCGGPAPPLDECASDADCQSGAGPRICEPRGYCHQRICVAACVAADDCQAFEACDATGRCQPKSCDASADCGPHHACSAQGTCQRRTCSKSSECAAYCVTGQCFADPGSCINAMAL